MGRAGFILRVHAGGVAGAFAALAMLSYGTRADPAAAGSFFPVAAWHGGGTARAPMMSHLDASSPAAWITGDGQPVFVFSNSAQAADAGIALRLPWMLRAAHDVITGSDVALGQDHEDTILHRMLPPHGIWVVSLDRR